MTVVALPQSTTNDQAIQVLEDCLKQARSGEIAEVIIIAKRPNRRWSHHMSGTANLPESIGQLELLKACWLADYNNEHVSDLPPPA